MYTRREGQKRLVFDLVQTDAEGQQHPLGRFEFGPFPLAAARRPIEVTIKYNSEGLVEVSALDVQTGHQVERTFDEAHDSNPQNDRLAIRQLVHSVSVNP